jgi:molybdopterin synthase catalytic subunit
MSDHGAVTQLQLDHYPGFTEAQMRRLAEQTAQRHEVDALIVVHRVGSICAGEPIVLVAAQSAHRAAAFAAIAELMDYLKTDAPFWKREIGPGGTRWIEPTEHDRARRNAHGDDT